MATINNQKPTTGILKYGNKLIAENKTFRELSEIQRKLIAEGYEKKILPQTLLLWQKKLISTYMYKRPTESN